MRLPRLAPLLLAACVSALEGRVVILESEAYGCGAAEGLGCGLAIAPVLERVDALEGVEESGVSWDGRYFRIGIAPGSDPERVAAEAAALLEGEACCVTARRGKAAPGALDRWYDAAATVELSRHEAGVIAADFLARVQAEVELAPESAERLHAIFREELERAFEQAHARGGGVERLWEQMPESWPRVEARVAELLCADRAERVLAVLERRLGE